MRQFPLKQVLHIILSGLRTNKGLNGPLCGLEEQWKGSSPLGNELKPWGMVSEPGECPQRVSLTVSIDMIEEYSRAPRERALLLYTLQSIFSYGKASFHRFRDKNGCPFKNVFHGLLLLPTLKYKVLTTKRFRSGWMHNSVKRRGLFHLHVIIEVIATTHKIYMCSLRGQMPSDSCHNISDCFYC